MQKISQRLFRTIKSIHSLHRWLVIDNLCSSLFQTLSARVFFFLHHPNGSASVKLLRKSLWQCYFTSIWISIAISPCPYADITQNVLYFIECRLRCPNRCRFHCRSSLYLIRFYFPIIFFFSPLRFAWVRVYSISFHFIWILFGFFCRRKKEKEKRNKQSLWIVEMLRSCWRWVKHLNSHTQLIRQCFLFHSFSVGIFGETNYE